MEIGGAAAYRHQRALQLSNLLELKTSIFGGGRADRNPAATIKRLLPDVPNLRSAEFSATRQILPKTVAPNFSSIESTGLKP
jgi:hypothetical protein